MSLDVSPNEDYMCISLDTNNIGLIQTKSIGLNEDLNKEIKFNYVCKGFHSGSISTIDIAVQRPLILTCSKEDSTIRLWNYKTFACEMAREYYVLEDVNIRETAKPLISAAIHPSGYYMTASFIDKIRFYHILHDEFKHYKNIDIRSCKHMKFSSGGHLFACMEGNELHIYDSYKIEKLHTIDVAVADKQIKSIVFGEKDLCIALAGNGGYCGRWSLPSYECIIEKLPEEHEEDLNYSCIDFVNLSQSENQSDPNMLVVSGS